MQIPKQFQDYPNPWEENINLVVKIKETQAMLEGPPKTILTWPTPSKSSLESICEVALGVECVSEPIFCSMGNN